ncbi:MAG: threonylcarbamoyl-AMP synthase [Flavobacteriales bacterium]|nr:threonylcarbamoyl-AMP synthase [Flavobacteriales bacterium]
MRLEIHPTHPEQRKVQRVVEVLRAGGVVICPTDTVYAFVCSAHQSSAIERVARLKGVKPQKAELSLICPDLSELSLYTRAVDTAAFRLLKRTLPGPYTYILPASAEIPRLFKNNRRTAGIRVPDHAIPQAICRELGHALVAASVHDPDKVVDYTTDPERMQEHLGHAVDLVIDAGTGGLEGSTVIDLTQGPPVVIRAGKGPVDDIS